MHIVRKSDSSLNSQSCNFRALKIIGWSEAEKGCVLLFTIKTPRQALILQRILAIPGQVLQRELDNSGMCSNGNIACLLLLF